MPFLVFGQTNPEAIAREYFQKEEYEKVIEVLEDVQDNDALSYSGYKYLLNAYIRTQEFKSAEKLAKREMKSRPYQVGVAVDLGFVYRQKGDQKKAEKTFQDLIDQVAMNEGQVIQLVNALKGIREQEFALNLLESANQKLGGGLEKQLAELYVEMNEPKRGIETYLAYLSNDPSAYNLVRYRIQQIVEEKDLITFLQSKLFSIIQLQPNQTQFQELLVWTLLSQGDFDEAVRQMKAMDRRLSDNGQRLFGFAKDLFNQGEFELARTCFTYILETPNHSGYEAACSEYIARAYLAELGPKSDSSELLQTKQAIQVWKEEVKRNPYLIVNALRVEADFYMNYEFNPNKAIQIMEEGLEIPNIRPEIKAEFKLQLADYYLIAGQPWDATLLYMQVDKQFKESPIGEEARFKNARLSYFTGEFELAQEQLGVLKYSTSELISNDAIELSVFITENLGLDSSTVPMQLFAEAELYYLQNNFEEVRSSIEFLTEKFPKHGLTDDVLYLEARMSRVELDTTSAMTKYAAIIQDFPDELKADDALYELAKLNLALGNQAEAMEQFKQLMLNYPDSIYVISARANFRALRGDKLEKDENEL